MAAYSSTQSGNFNSASTWGGSGWPNADGDTYTVNAGHVVTYNLTTPLHGGLGSSSVTAGGTLILDNNTVMRINGATTYSFFTQGNFIVRPGVKILLKGTTASERVFDIRPFTFTPTTATGTSGDNTITVASNANQLYVNNKVSGTGIASGAYITNINGNIITLSANNTGAVSGNLTVGNYVEIIGSEGMPITTVSSNITQSEYNQGFITATSVSEFSVGDWIAVFKRGYSNVLSQRNDEGFIIHEIDGNNIYIKEFVGPSSTILSSSGSTITVSNSKVFRKWQTLIFGTGANRNIKKITDINYSTNVITFASAVSGNVNNIVAYTTGPFYSKSIGDKIRKVATTVLTNNNSTTTRDVQFTNVSGFSVGDEVIVSSKWDASTESSFTDERPEKRNIVAINGNTVTLNQPLGYRAFAEEFIFRSTRDIEILGDYEITLTLNAAQSFAQGDVITQAYSLAKGVVKTATTNSTSVIIHFITGQFITGTTNSPWLSKNGTPIATNVYCSTVTISGTEGHCGVNFARLAGFTTNFLPVLYFRDVEVGSFSNFGTTSSRLFIRGNWSSLTDASGGVEIEGISFTKPNQGDNFNYQDNGLMINRFLRNATARCNLIWNSQNGLWANEYYDLHNLGLYNNASLRSENNGINLENFGGGGGSLLGAAETAYNYSHRSDDNGIAILNLRAPERGIHHNWIDVAQVRPIYLGYCFSFASIYQNRFDNFFDHLYSNYQNHQKLIYNEFNYANNLYDFSQDAFLGRQNFSVPFGQSIVSLEHNYEYDAVSIFIHGGLRKWDPLENAWKCTFDNDSILVYGLGEIFYVPSGTAVNAKGLIKLDPNHPGTNLPYIEIRDVTDRYYLGSNTTNLGDNPNKGYGAQSYFTSNDNTRYQSAEVNIGAKDWGRILSVSINNTANYTGYWEKPIEVTFDKDISTPYMQTGFDKFSANININSNLNSNKVRLGGRII